MNSVVGWVYNLGSFMKVTVLYILFLGVPILAMLTMPQYQFMVLKVTFVYWAVLVAVSMRYAWNRINSRHKRLSSN